MTQFNLIDPNLTTVNSVPGTSTTHTTIWLDTFHKLTIRPLPDYLRPDTDSYGCLDRTRKYTTWRYTQRRFYS